MPEQASEFDVIVVGAGPAGETVASRRCARGMRTALVERELLGGECAYWACIPSKTLLRPGELLGEAERTAGTARPAQRFDEIASYRDFMVRDHADTDEAKGYAERGVRVYRGAARFAGSGSVEVGDELLGAERIVIATGSEPVIPDIPGLEATGYWTNREATSMRGMPASACVLGGGPVGVELAQMLHRFGAQVHLIDQRSRLLAREDERVSELLLDALRDDGIRVNLCAEIASVEVRGGERVVNFGEDTVHCEQLVVASARRPRIAGLALESAGIAATEAGIVVDERCRAGDGVWAVGDVTGVMPFSHVAMYQARVACADILGEPARADYSAVPRAVFCDPEVAAVGRTERQAREEGIDVVLARVVLRDTIARPWTYETDARGELTVIADRERRVLVGAWAVAPLASEWIHYAALAIKAELPISLLTDTVAQFPTYTEAFLKALEQLEL